MQNKGVRLLFIGCFIFFLQGCSILPAFSSPQLHSNEKEDPVTLIFSDPDRLSDEANYYDAVLAVQQDLGEQVTELVICDASERHIINYYDIDEFPAMLVYKGDDEKLRISGKHDITDLYVRLEGALKQ
ncbi:hypothetical protein J1TS1_15950 [Shouchella clausii]|uniref:hypothetical protein n=1 Tax=Shouchella clausii TaxID=79880 RepID=UPI001B08B9E7|nr:hypothetical protein [Shouchella clausii]GIN07450.1 hypothetical protein J1TS1_15950 [Shouchella clausii]